MTIIDGFLGVLIVLTFLYDRIQCMLLYDRIDELEKFVDDQNKMVMITIETIGKTNAILHTKYDRSPEK